MYKNYFLVFLCCTNVTYHAQAIDSDFLSDIQNNVRKIGETIERRVSTFFDDDIDTMLDSAQDHINEMQSQFSKIKQQFVDRYESFTKKDTLSTIQDTNDSVIVTVNVGEVETDMIENHLEQDVLVISLPKNKPSLRIAVHPDFLEITGNKFEEKEKKEDNKITSHIISSRAIHFQQNLPVTVVTHENVNITHSADEKTLAIELPKKIHAQQFSVKKK